MTQPSLGLGDAAFMRTLLPILLCLSALCPFTWSTPARALGVRLSAFSERGDGYLVYGGWLLVDVSLDRWFRPAVPVSVDPVPVEDQLLSPWAQRTQTSNEDDSAAPPPRAEATDQDTPESGAEPAPAPAKSEDDANTEQPPPAGDGDAETPKVPPWRLSSDLVEGLVAAALAEHAERAERFESLSSRSRNSAWLPAVRLRAGRNIDQTVRLTPTNDDPDRFQLTGGADLRLEAQLSWELDRVVFASEELAIERLRLQAASRRAQLVDTVLDWLLRWQTATLAAADPLSEPLERIGAELRAEHARAVLDVLSQGWFSRALRQEVVPASAD